MNIFMALFYNRPDNFRHPASAIPVKFAESNKIIFIELRGEKTGLLFRKLVSEANRCRKSNPADRPKLHLKKENSFIKIS